MRQQLHITVMPEPCTEEMADCNWIPWMVVGHEDTAQMAEKVMDGHVQTFLATLTDEWDEDRADKFLDYMDTQGYTTFNTTRLSWCTK